MEYLPHNFSEVFTFVTCKRNRIPLNLFLLLCFNVLLAPAVQAATPVELSRSASYAIALLGLVTLSLCVYLFVVIFQPEKF
ncbi:potassium-transporting ATPase subunit F [Nostoc sp. MG11]|uniref:potassium-transporting ATPase subunit F n=1 Tax=Nostoc sp. MG11 TaxID=2721166 RepID=UPI001868BAC1|nr:potassium-transporting ATPase subunit F [Nostoc sp. MG11]